MILIFFFFFSFKRYFFCPTAGTPRTASHELETWIHAWKTNGWKTSARKPVKNAERWRELDALATQRGKTARGLTNGDDSGGFADTDNAARLTFKLDDVTGLECENVSGHNLGDGS